MTPATVPAVPAAAVPADALVSTTAVLLPLLLLLLLTLCVGSNNMPETRRTRAAASGSWSQARPGAFHDSWARAFADSGTFDFFSDRAAAKCPRGVARCAIEEWLLLLLLLLPPPPDGNVHGLSRRGSLKKAAVSTRRIQSSTLVLLLLLVPEGCTITGAIPFPFLVAVVVFPVAIAVAVAVGVGGSEVEQELTNDEEVDGAPDEEGRRKENESSTAVWGVVAVLLFAVGGCCGRMDHGTYVRPRASASISTSLNLRDDAFITGPHCRKNRQRVVLLWKTCGL